MSEIYEVSVRDYRQEAHKRVALCHRSYDRLDDKTTTYARSIQALMDVHEQVASIWDGMSDTLPNVKGETSNEG